MSIRFGDDSISSSPASEPSSPTDADSSGGSPASTTRDSFSQSRQVFGCSSTTRIPVNLHVCRDSRREALRTYKLSFGIGCLPGTVFFDPSRDVLYFGRREGYMASLAQFQGVLALLSSDELASVTRLAISDDLFWTGDRYDSMTAARLTLDVLSEIRARMLGLRELIFVVRDDEDSSLSAAASAEAHGAAELTFVPPKLIGMHRMQRQIETAIDAIVERYPGWKCPEWRVMALADARNNCASEPALPSSTGEWDWTAGDNGQFMGVPRMHMIGQTLIWRFNLLETR